MQGINQLHNEIKNLSDQQLVQLMQDPRSTLPKYMVLAEIEGRKPIRQAFDAANVQQPMMTIADESVQEFMGGNPMPSAPMMGAQGFASGKSTAREAIDDYNQELKEIYEKQQRYKNSRGKFFNLRPHDYIVSDEEYNRMKERGTVMGEGDLQDYRPLFMLMNLLDGESGPRFMPESKVKGLKAKIKASQVENKLNQMGMASGGSTGYQEGGFIKGGLQTLGVLDEEGEIDPVQAALLAATFLPGVGLGLRVGQGAFKVGKGLASLIKSGAPEAAKFTARQGQKLITKPGPIQAKATRINRNQPMGDSAKALGLSDDVSRVTTQGRRFSPSRAYTTFVSPTAGYTALSRMGDAAKERDAKEQERLEKVLQERNKELNKNNAGGLNDLISGPVKSDRKKMSGLELAQLGGIIAGSVDLSDLGKGIGLLATEKAKNKRDAALAERKLGIDERRVTAMEEANVLKQNQFLVEQLAAQMEVDYPLFLSASDKIAKGKTPADNEQQAFDRYTKNLAEYQNIMGMGVASNNNDDAFASRYITQAG